MRPEDRVQPVAVLPTGKMKRAACNAGDDAIVPWGLARSPHESMGAAGCAWLDFVGTAPDSQDACQTLAVPNCRRPQYVGQSDWGNRQQPIALPVVGIALQKVANVRIWVCLPVG